MSNPGIRALDKIKTRSVIRPARDRASSDGQSAYLTWRPGSSIAVTLQCTTVIEVHFTVTRPSERSLGPPHSLLRSRDPDRRIPTGTSTNNIASHNSENHRAKDGTLSTLDILNKLLHHDFVDCVRTGVREVQLEPTTICHLFPLVQASD